MAYTAANLVQDALEVIFTALAADKTTSNSKYGVQALQEVANALNSMSGYGGNITDITITDATDAGVSEFIATSGEGAALAVLDLFRCAVATTDLTDNALATAKGSAVAANDIFVVDGADSVEYLGTSAQDRAFLMSTRLVSDFG